MADFKGFAKQFLKEVAQGVAQGVVQNKIDNTNDPDELCQIFYLTSDNNTKRSIINKLINLKAVNELMSLLGKGFNRIIVHSLVSLCSNDKEVLFKLFGKVNDKQLISSDFQHNYNRIIVKSLINLKATQELKKLLDCGYNSLVVPYLISVYKDPNDICSLFGADKNSDKKIIDYLIIKDESYLIENLIGRGYDSKIVPFLIESYSANPKKLKKLMGFNKEYDDIIYDRLVSINAKEELKELVQNGSEYKYDIVSSDETINLFDRDEASNFIKEEIFEKSNDPDSCERSLLNILKIFSSMRNPSAVKVLMTKYFTEVFEYGLKKCNYSALITLYLLDKSRFNNLVSTLEFNYKIVSNVEVSKHNIKKDFSSKIAMADNKNEVEELLLQRNLEINKLVPHDINIMLAKIKKSFDRGSQENFRDLSRATKIEILNLNDCIITDDKESDILKLEDQLRGEVYNLEDSNDIMRAKAKYKRELSNLVDRNDLIFSIVHLSDAEINSENYIAVLGNLLIKSKDYRLKKLIMQKSAESSNLVWLDYYEKIEDFDNYNYELISALNNKISSKNLRIFLSKIEESDSVPFLVQIYFLINNTDATDIKHLKEAIALLEQNRSLEDKEDIKEILENMIKKSGKSSKEIEISDWNNSGSRDISISR
jgi:hypothetical protein